MKISGRPSTKTGSRASPSNSAACVRERRPGLIVIDSFKALQAFAADYGEFRKFLHELAGRLGAFPAASLWVGEYEDAEIASMAEFAVADAILEPHLRTDRAAGGPVPVR